MALEAGSVFVKLGALFSRDDFDKWDRAVDAERVKARDPIEVKLAADNSQLGRDIAEADAQLAAWRSQKAEAKLGADTSGLDTAIRLGETRIRSLKGEMDKLISTQLFPQAQSDRVAQMSRKMQTLEQDAKRTGKEVRLLAPAFEALGRSMRNAGNDGSLLQRSLSGVGAGGTGLGGGSGRGGGIPLPFTRARLPAPLAALLAPLGAGAVGSLGPLVGSAGAAAGGAGALGIGGLGVGGVGFGALLVGLKPVAGELKTANQALNTYEQTVARYGATSTQAQVAETQMNFALRNQSPLILDTVKSLTKFRTEWQAATKPATTAGVGIIEDFVNKADQNLGKLSGMVNSTTKSARTALDGFFSQLFDKRSLGILQSLDDTFNKGLSPGLKGVANSLQALGNIAVATEPYLLQIDHSFENWSKHFLGVTNNSDLLDSKISHLVSQTHSWWDLMVSLGHFLVAFFGSGAQQGQTMVDKLTAIVDKGTEWINQEGGRQKIQQFFQNSTKLMGSLFKAIGPILLAFGKLTGSLMPALAKLLDDIAPVVKTVLDAFGGLVKWVTKLVDQNPALKVLLGTVVGIALAWKGISFLGQITGLGKLLGLYKDLKLAAEGAAGAEALGGVAGGAGAAGAAATGAEGAAAGAAGGGLGSKLLKTLAKGVTGAAGLSLAESVGVVAVPAVIVTALIAALTSGSDRRTGGQIAAQQGAHQLANIAGLDAGQIRSIVGRATPMTGRPGGPASGPVGNAGRLGDLNRFLSQASGAHVTQLVNKSDVKGLQDLADQAKALAKDFPAASEKLDEFAKKLEGLKKDTPDAAIRKTADTIKKFQVDGSSSVNKLFDRFHTNMRLIASTIGDNTAKGKELASKNVDEMVKHLSQAVASGKIKVGDGMKAMTKLADEESGKLHDAVVGNYGDMFKAIKTAYANGKVNQTTANKELRQLADQQSTALKQDVQNIYKGMFNNLAQQHQKGFLTDQQYSQKKRQLAHQEAGDIAQTNIKLVKGVGGLYSGLDTATQNAIVAMSNDVNKALVAMGVNKVNFNVSVGGGAANAAGKAISGAVNAASGVLSGINTATRNATGGYAPGAEFGMQDRMVLVDPTGAPRALMAGDEGIFTRHQMPEIDHALSFTKAMGAGAYGSADELWSGVNRPHGYQQGGQLPAFASGGSMSSMSHYQRLVAAANKVNSANFPYSWGGGHEQPAQFQPFDCSGAVSYAVQQAGYRVPTVTAQDIGSWGFPKGAGQASVFYTAGFPGQAAHTFMKIGNRYWGTSGFARPNGGAGWFDQSPPASYLSGFNEVHLPDLGAAMLVPKMTLNGPAGALTSIGQGSMDIVRSASNKLLAAKSRISGAGGGGNSLESGWLTQAKLNAINHMYAANGSDQFSPDFTAQLAETGGLPGVTFSQIAHGESDYKPGALEPVESIGVGGVPVRGWGMWQMTTGVGNDALINKYGGTRQMFNPVRNMLATRDLYHTQGIGAWHGTRYMTSTNAHLPASRRPHNALKVPGFMRGGFMGRAMRAGVRRFAGGGRLYTPKKPPKPKQHSIKQQPNIPKAARALIGGFGQDDAAVNNLESLYQRQSDVYSLVDAGGSLSQDQLNVLAGIRFKEWDILERELHQVPNVLDKLTLKVKGKAHTTHTPASAYPGAAAVAGLAGALTHGRPGKAVGSTQTFYTGPSVDIKVHDINKKINDDTKLIAQLNKDLLQEQHASAVAKHGATAKAMAAASSLAGQLAGLTDQLTAEHNKNAGITRQINQLTQALQSATGNNYASIQHKIDALRGTRGVSQKAQDISNQIKAVEKKRAAQSAQLRKENFDAAWKYETDRWKIGKRIANLQVAIENLKKELKREQKLQTAYNSAIGNLQQRLTGGGDSSGAGLQSNLADIGEDILSLQQQGAVVPNKRVNAIIKLLQSLGVQVPSGISSAPTQTADAAFADFLNFQAAQASLFSSFGSNFVPAGASPFGGTAGLGANVQYYGAAGGAGSGLPTLPPTASGKTEINIEQNFNGVPDPHTQSVGLVHEIGAQM